MMSLGLGSFLGPLLGRAILWHDQIRILVNEGNWQDVGRFLFNVIKTESEPSLAGFHFILWGLAGVTALGAVVMWTWGQRPGRWQGGAASSASANTPV